MTRTAVTRIQPPHPASRRSLFQASALVRFLIAGLLSSLLWAAILWAMA